jgi:ubiquinone/menaquinone biosynthesis C-methylase UbiE
VTDVARRFDRMADSYDELEPWYEHLYERLHSIVRIALTGGPDMAPRPPTLGGPRPTRGAPRRALDAGCGTGFQTALLRGLGFTAHGVDLSAGLLAVARSKLPGVPLARGDLEALPYRDASFDAVTCGGSTLSFVDHPPRALAEIGRVLRPGGTLVLEVEHKWSLDLLWALASALTGDALGYRVTLADAVRQVARPWSEGFRVDYPGYLSLRLFTMAEIAPMLRAAELVPHRIVGIHGVTNLIPSTVLHRERLPRGLDRVYRVLCSVDRALGATPAWRAANSLVVVATKLG